MAHPLDHMLRFGVDHHPDLSIGEIHVWTARFSEDDGATADLLTILDEEERARAAKFSFKRDRTRFIQAHGVLRRILASYSGGDATMLTFARNASGKPYLVRRTSGPDLEFSLSHSGDCCLLAVQLDHAIGIDVEQVRDVSDVLDIAQRYFTPTESKLLADLQGTDRRDAFFALWTHKEATIKALGLGLAGNLGRIEFDLDPLGGPRFVGYGGDQSLVRSWSFLRLDPAPGYVAAVVSAHPIRALRSQNWNGAGAD